MPKFAEIPYPLKNFSQKTLPALSGLFLLFFGLLTIFMGGSVIFDLFGIRRLEGHYVPFVLWVNWFCGFIYLIAGYGFLKMKKWTSRILWSVFTLLVVTYIGLFIHIQLGGVYETKTVVAMAARTFITLILALIAYFILIKKTSHETQI